MHGLRTDLSFAFSERLMLTVSYRSDKTNDMSNLPTMVWTTPARDRCRIQHGTFCTEATYVNGTLRWRDVPDEDTAAAVLAYMRDDDHDEGVTWMGTETAEQMDAAVEANDYRADLAELVRSQAAHYGVTNENMVADIVAQLAMVTDRKVG